MISPSKKGGTPENWEVVRNSGQEQPDTSLLASGSDKPVETGLGPGSQDWHGSFAKIPAEVEERERETGCPFSVEAAIRKTGAPPKHTIHLFTAEMKRMGCS
eukprot:TRINITY_DN39944_c0_g1_i1.p3 TRINITY_DN39944_c0_g1~~TRINITY_DN39944_c0_g1_i1.p3  ORF type:complete len:102 (+),score=15.25 TRINITY_DN39944_c0_g1_i1:322-627(+)